MNKEILKEINEIRKNGNFQTIKNRIGEEKLKEFINSIYPKFSITEIETITGIPDSTLGHWFKRLGIPFTRNHITNYSIPGNSNEEIIVTKGAITQKVSTIKITQELAYLIGFTLGDGNVQKFMVDVFNKDKKLKEVLFNILKSYGPVTKYEREDGLWRLRLSSVKIANLIKNKKIIRKDTINYIFDNNKFAKNFISGFWDAEGSVWHTPKKPNYYHIYLFNSKDYLLNKIKGFLQSKKIEFSILDTKPTKRIMNNGEVIHSKKIVRRISIPKSSSVKWAKEIGIHLKHSKKSNNVKKLLQEIKQNEQDDWY